MSLQNFLPQFSYSSPLSTSVGRPQLFYTIPFTICDRRKVNLKTLFANKSHKSELIRDQYTSDYANQQGELLELLSKVDEEVYSSRFRKDNPFSRYYLGTALFQCPPSQFMVDIVITIHSKNYGSVLLIAKFEQDLSYSDFMEILRTVQKSSTPDYIFSYPDKKQQSYSIDNLLQECYVLFSKKNNRPVISRTFFQLGESYPFIVLHSNCLKIIDTKKYIFQNAQRIYGLANIDYWGWQRTRHEEAIRLMDIDLSRRNEYSFFITPHASLEIDSRTRKKQVEEWAKNTSQTSERVHLKLLLERVLDIEVLRIQHHIMMWLDMEISQAVISKTISYKEITRLRTKIAEGLNDFYNIRSQDRGHVSGTAWISYGQHRIGIDRLYESLKERIECLEMRHDVYLKSAEFELTGALSVISILLSASASGQIANMLIDIPFLQGYSIIQWKWLLSIGIFLILVIMTETVFIRTTHLAKTGSQ